MIISAARPHPTTPMDSPPPRGTGYALVKALRAEKPAPSTPPGPSPVAEEKATNAAATAPTSPLPRTRKKKKKSKTKAREKQYLIVSLASVGAVPVAQLALKLAMGQLDATDTCDGVPSELPPAGTCVVRCVGEAGVINGSLTVGYMGVLPQRKNRKKRKESPTTTAATAPPAAVATGRKDIPTQLHSEKTANAKEKKQDEQKEQKDAQSGVVAVAAETAIPAQLDDEKTPDAEDSEEKEQKEQKEPMDQKEVLAAVDEEAKDQTNQKQAAAPTINPYTFHFAIGVPHASTATNAATKSSVVRRNYLTRPGTVADSERQKLVLVDLGSNNAVDIRLSDSQTKPGESITLDIKCRAATKKELDKEDATQAILRTMNGTRHSPLHASIVRGRAAFVETKLLELASSKLLRLNVSHPNIDRVRKALQWSKVTRGGAQDEVVVAQCALSGCNVGQPEPGQVMDIEHDALRQAMRLFPMTKENRGRLGNVELNGEWLFDKIAQAAKRGGGPKGGVWFTGKHVMFSNPNRNQSPVALKSYLQRLDCRDCALAMDCLVSYVELKYSKSVSAVQINLHLDGNSCHKQHHDIYSIKQREKAGRDCTCSFKNNVATACFSIGSSRRVKLNAQRGGGEDGRSKRCCEECVGVSRKPWLHSGDLMYFNDTWNKAWTHGIPKHDVEADGAIGPRISIALLCANADPAETLKRMSKLHGLAIPGFEQCSTR